MSKRSWLNVSTSLFSLLWGLTASGLTACRDNVGSCSTDTTTLCLQIDLESRAQVPHFLNVSVGSTRQATLQKELDAAPLATRPYMLEIKPTVDSTVSLTIDVQGVDHDPATGSSVPVATLSAPLMLQLATAARPTLVTLRPVPSSANDMSVGGPADMAGGADLRPADMANPWSAVPSGLMSTPPLLAIGGTGTTVYVVGYGGTVLQATGPNYTFTAKPGPTGAGNLTGLWVNTASDLWVIDTTGHVWHSIDSASTWQTTTVAATGALLAIAGRSTTGEIVVAGADPSNGYYYNGTVWALTPIMLGTATRGLAASGNYFVAVGDGTKAARSSNLTMAWSAIGVGTVAGTPNLLAIVSNNNQGFIATSDGQLLALSLGFGNLMSVTSAAGQRFNALWFGGAQNIWLAGSASAVFNWKGAASPVDNGPGLPGGLTLNGVWGDGTGTVFVVGSDSSSGYIFRR